MNVRIFCVCVMKCMCAQTRPWFILSSKTVRTHVNSKGKIPSTRGSEEGQSRDIEAHRTASPTHYGLSYSSPMSDLQWKILHSVLVRIFSQSVKISQWVRIMRIDQLHRLKFLRLGWIIAGPSGSWWTIILLPYTHTPSSNNVTYTIIIFVYHKWTNQTSLFIFCYSIHTRVRIMSNSCTNEQEEKSQLLSYKLSRSKFSIIQLIQFFTCPPRDSQKTLQQADEHERREGSSPALPGWPAQQWPSGRSEGLSPAELLDHQHLPQSRFNIQGQNKNLLSQRRIKARRMDMQHPAG